MKRQSCLVLLMLVSGLILTACGDNTATTVPAATTAAPAATKAPAATTAATTAAAVISGIITATSSANRQPLTTGAHDDLLDAVLLP